MYKMGSKYYRNDNWVDEIAYSKKRNSVFKEQSKIIMIAEGK